MLVDSGPLISLAACKRLDLLDSFSRRVRIVDVVKAECLREMDKIGASSLKAWFQQLDGEKYAVEPTPLLDDYIAAVKLEEEGDQTRPSARCGSNPANRP